MEIKHGSVVLRDYRETDIEDDVRWMTTETGWMQADTPWEEFEPVDPEKLRADLRSMVGRYAPGQMRSRMEIVAGQTHIGFVCTYPLAADFSKDGCVEAAGEKPTVRAVGIELCEPSFRRRGLGALALEAWMEYLRDRGEAELYLETWSGNEAMKGCAEKLGFTLCHCTPGIREVKGEGFDALVYRAKLI